MFLQVTKDFDTETFAQKETLKRKLNVRSVLTALKAKLSILMSDRYASCFIFY